MGERRLFTKAEKKDRDLFLTEVSRRKGKSKHYYTDIVDSCLSNPTYKEITLASGKTIMFLTVAEHFTILDETYIDFAILSNGDILTSTYWDEYKFVAANKKEIIPDGYYREFDYKLVSEALVNTTPNPVPDWALDLVMRERYNRYRNETFAECLNKQVKLGFYTKLAEVFSNENMLKHLVSNDSSSMDLPLSHFYDGDRKGYSSWNTAHLLREGVVHYIDNITCLHKHQPPGDPVWQVTIRDILARYITEKEFIGG